VIFGLGVLYIQYLAIFIPISNLSLMVMCCAASASSQSSA
jgi:hypothetical protein